MHRIFEMTHQIHFDAEEEWERRLELFVNPKPWWMPIIICRRILSLVLVQEVGPWNRDS